jgi:nucleotide-binding universal stress UspA family protein
MGTILACIDASAAARPVLQTAAALGGTLTLPVVALHVRQDDLQPPRQFADAAGIQLRVATGAPIDTIATALAAEEVALGVLGARGLPGGRRPAGHTALAVARHTTSRWWWSRRCRATRPRPAYTGCWSRWTAPTAAQAV